MARVAASGTSFSSKGRMSPVTTDSRVTASTSSAFLAGESRARGYPGLAWLLEELRVGTGPHEDDQARFPAVVELVGEQEVAADVAFPVSVPVAA